MVSLSLAIYSKRIVTKVERLQKQDTTNPAKSKTYRRNFENNLMLMSTSIIQNALTQDTFIHAELAIIADKAVDEHLAERCSAFCCPTDYLLHFPFDHKLITFVIEILLPICEQPASSKNWLLEQLEKGWWEFFRSQRVLESLS